MIHWYDRINEKFLPLNSSSSKKKSFQWIQSFEEFLTRGLLVISNDVGESTSVVSCNSRSGIFVVGWFWALKICIESKNTIPKHSRCYSNVCSSDDFVNIGLLDGVIAIGTESFHWTSPNWISIGWCENRIDLCMQTAFWGIIDETEFFFWLLSNVNDWDVPPENSYSSIDDDTIGVIFSWISEDDVTSTTDLIWSVGSFEWLTFRRLMLFEYEVFPRRSRLIPPRSDGVGDVCWERERSLSLWMPLFDDWSLGLVGWVFFLWWLDFAVCQPPFYEQIYIFSNSFLYHFIRIFTSKSPDCIRVIVDWIL